MKRILEPLVLLCLVAASTFFVTRPTTRPHSATPTARASGEDASKNSKTIRSHTGLVYEILADGSGAKAEKSKTVSVHYIGKLENGTEFDSSRKRGEPIEFELGSGIVIDGWEEGIEGMKVGERRKLIIPAKLAYGPEGRPPMIPRNATLIFDVELMDVKSSLKAPPQPPKND